MRQRTAIAQPAKPKMTPVRAADPVGVCPLVRGESVCRVGSSLMVSGIDPLELRAAREKAGLTQHELARLVGAAGGERISRWELGTSVPRPEFLVKLARALDIPTLRLVHFDGEIPDLRALRLQAGLTVPDLAAGVNVAVPTYYAWEQGRWTRLPASKTLEVLARAFGESFEVVAAAFNEAQRQRRRRGDISRPADM
jgi:transcriptional regulator with XRE-family HTH domain